MKTMCKLTILSPVFDKLNYLRVRFKVHFFLFFRQLDAKREEVYHLLKKIIEERDDYARVSILFSGPKVVRIPKISAHASGCLNWSVQIFSL